jgi:hypothetical protein
MLAINETSGRGALHVHGLFWGGVPANVLRDSIVNEELQSAVSSVLDSVIVSRLPSLLNVQTEDDDSDAEEKEAFRGTLTMCPKPVESVAYEERLAFQLKETNLHSHSFTCHKKPGGRYICRMAMKQPLNI